MADRKCSQTKYSRGSTSFKFQLTWLPECSNLCQRRHWVFLPRCALVLLWKRIVSEFVHTWILSFTLQYSIFSSTFNEVILHLLTKALIVSHPVKQCKAVRGKHRSDPLTSTICLKISCLCLLPVPVSNKTTASRGWEYLRIKTSTTVPVVAQQCVLSLLLSVRTCSPAQEQYLTLPRNRV